MTDGPGIDRTDQRPGPHDLPARPPAVRLVGLAVTLTVLVGLVIGAVHGGRATAGLGSARQVSSARLDIAYYDCLTTQSSSLVRPGKVVDVSTANPGSWATLSKVVAPRDVLTTDRRIAVAVLTLERRPGGCLGSAVVAHYPNGTVRQGTGASLSGQGPPPAQPL